MDICYCNNIHCPFRFNCERSLEGNDREEIKYITVTAFKPKMSGCDYFMEKRKKVDE